MVKPEYQLSYDSSHLNNFKFINLQVNLKYFLCGPPKSEGEGIFYRIVQNNDVKCIQCIIFYKTQWIPYHPHDYHPFYIYLDANNCVKFLIIDDGHHFSKLIRIPENSQENSIDITLFLPDHGLTNQIRKFGKKFHPKLIPLLPEQIKKWWFINNMAQLKLRTKLIDPWAPGLIPDKPSKYQSLLYRLNHLLPAKFFSFVKEDLNFTFRDETTCPECGILDVLDFMSLHYDPPTGKYYLRKKMTCENHHRYFIRYDFDKGQIELE
ncbi:MAG: hypothetical protein ACTSQI_02180 [Candidatus Helarchaeota archaeon]